MSSWYQRFSLFLFTILLCASFTAAADLDSAKRAYQQRDYATAFKGFAPLAEKGDAEAQVNLGKMYLMGQGVLKDQDQAMKLFKESAAQGNADAQFFLGSLFLLPRTNIAEGLKWLRLSAEQGNQDAQLLLGKTYIDGNDELHPDPVQAEMWLRLAARGNLPFYEAQLTGAERQMNAEQIAKGKALAEAWKPKHGLRPDEKGTSEGKPGS